MPGMHSNNNTIETLHLSPPPADYPPDQTANPYSLQDLSEARCAVFPFPQGRGAHAGDAGDAPKQH